MKLILAYIKALTRCDYYIIIWCIVQLEEMLHIVGIISQGLQALLIVWALKEGSKYMLPDRRHPLLLRTASILLLMFTVYGTLFIILAPSFFTRDPHYVYLKSFLYSFLPLYLFYNYAREGYLTEKKIINYFYFFIITVLFQYFQLAAKLTAKFNADEVTNNIGYFFLSLMPMALFLYRRRYIQYFMIGFIILFILLSMKRGAIAIGAICLIWFLYDSIKKSTSIKHKYTTTILGTIISLAAIGTVSYLIENSEYMNKRIEQTENGNSSGRNVLYTGLIDAVINDESVIHLLWGRGAYSTMSIVHKFAHNDWLETACNNGLTGIICMLIYFFGFYHTAIKAKYHLRPEISSALLMLFFISFAKTFFSMSIQNMPIYITMIMAYVTNEINKKESPKYE